jgi:hypothetical protein
VVVKTVKSCNYLSFRALLLPAVAGLWVFVTATLAAPALPNINTNNVITITNAPYYATNNGATDNAVAISNAIVAAALGGNTNGLFGGMVRIPAPGVYLSGPFQLKNNVNLQIDPGAILRMLPYSQYPGGITNPPDYITGTSLTNLEISGCGAIDGQGAPWWPGYKTNERPMVVALSKCSLVLVQNFTISNAPAQNISIKGNNAGNVTIQGICVIAPASDAAIPSHNTDAIDFAETNGLIQNCYLDTGDDNIAFGSSSGLSRDILVNNCTNLAGHGISIGSYTSSGVSNINVINCTFNSTDNGIRIKSDNDHGGLVQNISYSNLGMTNVDFPIQIYSYYNWYGTPSGISPAIAASTNAATVTSTTPIYRNITFSNINATSVSGYPIGIIWARTEMPATNIVFNRVNVTGDRNFCLYNVNGAQFIDCSNLAVSATSNTFALYNAQLIITNSVFTTNLVAFDGLTTNGCGNTFAFYSVAASLKNTNVFDDGPLTIADSILAVSNNFMLFPGTVLNYTLDSNINRVAVVGNLALGGTINLTSGPGFGAGTNTLLTYTGTLSGNLPTLGSTPGDTYTYSFATNIAGLVNLIVALPAPSAPTNLTAMGTNLLIKLKWNAVSGAASYNLKRGMANGGPYPTVFSGLTVTNYSDAAVTNAMTYYYVVTALSGGESTNSLQASATVPPSAAPTNILVQISGGQLQLSWPQDHLGWQLQIQTNSINVGLGANWVNVPNSTTTNQIFISINSTNGSVFLRLKSP